MFTNGVLTINNVIGIILYYRYLDNDKNDNE